MRRLAGKMPRGARLHLSVLACSKGAEVYSILWTIRRSRPDLDITLNAVDISQEIVDFAQQGVYSRRAAANWKGFDPEGATGEERVLWNTYRDQGPGQDASLFERIDECEMESMFDLESDRASVKPWLKAGTRWRQGDAFSPELIQTLGPQDMVVANRFLCHMDPSSAERCLRNIGGLVKPGGYIFVSGVDLEVRTKVAREMGWEPVMDLMREIHEGDRSLTEGWPFGWWSLEPFCANRPDWQIRYASVFQIGKASSSAERENAPQRVVSNLAVSPKM